MVTPSGNRTVDPSARCAFTDDRTTRGASSSASVSCLRAVTLMQETPAPISSKTLTATTLRLRSWRVRGDTEDRLETLIDVSSLSKRLTRGSTSRLPPGVYLAGIHLLLTPGPAHRVASLADLVVPRVRRTDPRELPWPRQPVRAGYPNSLGIVRRIVNPSSTDRAALQELSDGPVDPSGIVQRTL